MNIWLTHKRHVWWISPLAAVLLVTAGCSGIEPFEPRDNREEGPERGLFSGSEGEFVIFRAGEAPPSQSEDKKSPDEAEEDKAEPDER